MTIIPLFEIAESGENVLTCTDDKKVFTSKYPSLKTFNAIVVESGDTVNHYVGYQPIYLYVSYQTSDFPNSVGLVGQYTLDLGAEIDVNATDIRSYTTSGFSADALVYVFIDELL